MTNCNNQIFQILYLPKMVIRYDYNEYTILLQRIWNQKLLKAITSIKITKINEKQQNFGGLTVKITIAISII